MPRRPQNVPIRQRWRMRRWGTWLGAACVLPHSAPAQWAKWGIVAAGSASGYCHLGEDCTDCGERREGGSDTFLCKNSCGGNTFDGVCDDGGKGAPRLVISLSRHAHRMQPPSRAVACQAQSPVSAILATTAATAARGSSRARASTIGCKCARTSARTQTMGSAMTGARVRNFTNAASVPTARIAANDPSRAGPP